MTAGHPIVAFLRARLAEDQAWAEACQGHHWQWVQSQTDEVITPDPMLGESLNAPDQYGEPSSSHMSLRSVEEKMSKPAPRPNGLPPFPGRMLPKSWPIYHCEEVNAAAAGHITQHGPARVLREIEAKRRIIDKHYPVDPCAAHNASIETIPCDTLLLLALPYSDYSDHREEWKP